MDNKQSIEKLLKLSKQQREILVGLLLGEASLESLNRGHTYQLKIERSEQQREYVYHLYDLFKDWVEIPPQESEVILTDSSSKKVIGFQTISHAAFRFYAHQFYGEQSKKIPKLIHRWLTPLNLAYWYMENGTISSSRVILYTHSIASWEVKRLVQTLATVFGLQWKERKQSGGYQLYLADESYERFQEIVEPYLLKSKSMLYEIPSKRTPLPKE